MRFVGGRFAARVCLLLALLTILPYLVLTLAVQRHDFKSFAEQKASEFLKAQVRIGRIRAGFLNQITLSGIELDSPSSTQVSPYRIEVGQMVFRYSVAQLLSLNFKTPAAIFFKSPKLVLNQNHLPYAFFDDIRFGTRKPGGISNLELSGGELRYEIPALHKTVRLRNIHGHLKPTLEGKMEMVFEAALAGDLSGRIEAHGFVDTVRKTHELELRFDHLKVSGSTFLGEQLLEGQVRWVGQDLYVDKLQSKSRGWQSEIRGSLLDMSGDPVLTLSWNSGENAQAIGVALKADLKTSHLEGQLRLPGFQDHAFWGTIERRGHQVLFRRLETNLGMTGQGLLDFESERLRLDFEKQSQRFSIKGSVSESGIMAHAEIHHAQVSGLDLVTSLKLHLNPVPAGGEPWKFRAGYETDYFILEFVSFEDLKGGFEISPSGLHDLTGTWGKIFNLQGDVNLRGGKPEEDVTVYVKGFDLKKVQEFAAKPLPKSLAGLLDGKLKIEGAPQRPEITGKFTIKDGALGKVSYDLGFVQFHGFPPYLALEDSRILKGRATFFLNGALDLSLENMLHGVELQTADKIILWKGWEVTRADTGADFEIEHPFSKLPTLTLKGESGPPASASVGAESVQEDHYAALGPKVKF